MEIFRHGESGRHHRISGGRSRFDPHLAEIAYEWYCPPSGHVYDPFAGGVTRGAVAHLTGRTYQGVDLSPAQVESNLGLARDAGWDRADWMVSDGTTHNPTRTPDYILTCPPYHTAERYSDHPDDLSVMAWEDHLHAVQTTAATCYRALRDDAFLTWVVGDTRGPDGHLRLLPERTALALTDAGFRPVNHQVLVTPVGTMHRMLRRWWTATSTAGRVHQHVLTMVKGDRRAATTKARGGHT